nr:cytochrome P450 [uncultured Roseococcus sp.]
MTIELVGDGRLVPAYPAALTAPPGIIRQAVLARRSLLYGWTEDCYDASDFEFRLLRRQVCVFNAPASVKSVLVTENSLFERKGAMMRRSLEPLLGDGLFISDGDTWQRRRPLVADLVHKARLPLFGPAMTNGVTELVDHWLTLCAGEEVDLLPTMATLTAGIIARAVFGVSLAGEALREIVEGFAAYQAQVDSLNLLYFLGNPEGRSLHGNRKLAETVGRIRSVIEDVIAAHRRGEGDEDSMIAAMLRRGHFEGEAGLRNEAVTLFMAGHETTATTLTWALYILGKAPWAVEALRQEVDSISGGQPVEVGDVPNLLLTRAIIDETMRLYPPVPILPRQALRDARIGSLDVEQDALVLVCPWLLHRSPDLWDDPMAFRPERFLGEARPQPYSYLPFSAGPRLCPGMSFGINEAVICLATIMGRMHLELRPGFVATPVCRLSLRPRHPILAQVRPR